MTPASSRRRLHSRAARTALISALFPLTLTGALLTGCGDDAPAGGSAAQQSASPAPSAAASANAEAVDQAFVRQMVPHHQMAVEMAEMAQQQADHQEIKTLADAIISAQEQEITELNAIAKQLGVTPGHAGTHGSDMDHGALSDDAKTLGLSDAQMGMSMDMDHLDGSKSFDLTFIDQMTVHHQGAINMAKAQLAHGSNPQLKKLSEAIVSAQQQEIDEMSQWRADWYPDAGAPSNSPASDDDHMSGMGH